jgi:pimeloyl-ACP methyl ester carboxylesterase
VKSHLQLLRWLGPWTRESRAPSFVPEEITIEGTERFRAFLYRPRHPRGAMLIAPGVHYAGPSDPRLDRFCRILAAADLIVLAPFLPDFIRMVITERVVADLDASFAAIDRISDRHRPGIFSISFGSLPALRVAALRGDRVGGLLVFGGYADFHGAVRHCLGGGDRARPRDPLNQPVVLMNLLDQLDHRPRDRERLLAAWRRYIESTWGRPEMKSIERHRPIAERIALDLCEEDRPLFLLGIGLEGDALAICAPILERASPPFLDPRPYLAQIRCPVHLVHGADDDVIPVDQASLLREAFPRDARVSIHLTGLFAHTGRSSGALKGALHEGVTLLRMLDAMVSVATRPRSK